MAGSCIAREGTFKRPRVHWDGIDIIPCGAATKLSAKGMG